MGASTAYNTRIEGDSFKTTSSLFLIAKVLGVSSAKTIVIKLSGNTTHTIASAFAKWRERYKWSRNHGANRLPASDPPKAAAIEPTSVMPICTTAKLPSIWSFIYKAASAPACLPCTSSDKRVREMEARAISYAAKRAFKPSISKITNSVIIGLFSHQ